MMKKQIALLFALSVAMMLNANNINVTNIKITGQNTTAGVNNAANYSLVQFDLSWENSWRTSSAPTNWDAAWVFVKYRVGAGDWQHARLNNDGHSGGGVTAATIAAGLIDPGSAFNATTNPALGVFVYRSANGTGTFTITGAQLRWNYGANGVTDNATVDVQVFAIEMVYVPQGAFTVGSGGTESGSFTNGSRVSEATVALSISSESELTIANSAGNLWGTSTSGDNTIGGTGSLPTAFPKGYAGFYCQKYEITQQQYVDFLNTLTQTQATNRKYTGSGNRYAITGSTVGSYTTTNPYVACNWLSWVDGAAYSDWAGLRPMTELEFEKACRGTLAQVANEYAWGNTTFFAASDITNPGASNETTNTSGATVVFGNKGNVQGPMRVGVFAKSGTTRVLSGASYYGIMELSGNLWEQAVSVGNATGRAFTGVHGNGALNTDGNADETAWPGATGSGFRGSSWDSINDKYLTVSCRVYAASELGRNQFIGFRAVRRVP